MARQVLPIVGQAVGGYFGGPWGAMIGGMIGSALGNAIDPLVVRGPKIGEAGLQTSAEGVFRPIVMGTGAVKGNIIDRGNRYIKIKRENQGKGSSGPKQETERVYWTWLIRICEAPKSGPIYLHRIWMDEKLVFDARPESEIRAETEEFAQRFRFYDGSEDQLPAPSIEAYRGVGNVPAYRGSVLAEFPNFDLTDFGERIPDFRFELSTTVTDYTWDYTWDGPYSIGSASTAGDGVYSEFNSAYVIATLAGRAVSFNGADSFTVYGADKSYGKVATSTLTGVVLFIRQSDGHVEMSADGGIHTSDTGLIASYGPGPFSYLEDEAYYYNYGENPFRINEAHNLLTVGEAAPVLGNVFWVKHPTHSFIIGCQDGNRFFKSSSGMGAWVEMTPCPTSNQLNALVLDKKRGVIFALFNDGIVYATDDGCETWRLAYDAGTGRNFAGGLYIEQLDVVYLTVSGGGNPNIFVTGDGGFDWITSFSVHINGPGGFMEARSLNELITYRTLTYARAHFDSQRTDLILSDVVSTLCERANLPTERYDTSDLTDLVTGIVFADDYTCGDAIRTLMPVYFFDSTEHDAGAGYKIHFPKRGRPVVVTLTVDDLVDIPDKTIRQDAYERPRVLHMAYQSPAVGYAPAKASPSRFSPDVKVVGEVSTQVPVSFADVGEAARRADMMLKVLWTGVAGEEEYTLPDSFLNLVTSDAIGMVLRGQVRRLLLSEQRYENGTLVCKFIADRQRNYTSNATGIPLPPPTPPPPSVVGGTVYLPLDIPALNDNNDSLLSYHAATGATEVWPGALIERSTDGGLVYEDLVRFNQNTIIGVLQSAISDASPHYTDRTNTLRVSLLSDDTIESLTDTQFLSEGGSIAVSWQSSAGRYWEVMQYRDAEQESDGTWTLSTLLRGRLNTETTEHESGDYVVFLDTVRSASNVAAHINRELTYRATSFGRSPDGSPVYSELYTAQSQREWPVAHLFLDRDGTTITGRIVPRHRFGTEDNPVRSINWSGYTLRFEDSTDRIEAFDAIADTFAFDASGMTFPVSVSVAQLNRWTGPGPSVTEIIE